MSAPDSKVPASASAPAPDSKVPASASASASAPATDDNTVTSTMLVSASYGGVLPGLCQSRLCSQKRRNTSHSLFTEKVSGGWSSDNESRRLFVRAQCDR